MALSANEVNISKYLLESPSLIISCISFSFKECHVKCSSNSRKNSTEDFSVISVVTSFLFVISIPLLGSFLKLLVV